MVCPKCGTTNVDGAQFCNRCGKELAEEAATVTSGEARFCYKHPKVETGLSCGRCGKAVCTNCVIIGPAGPRCKECAKQNVAVRPGAIAHEVKRGLFGVFHWNPWVTGWILILLAGAVFSSVRSCNAMNQQPEFLEDTTTTPSSPSQKGESTPEVGPL